MKPVLLQAEIPDNVTLIVKKNPIYRYQYHIYIKGHWLRSWLSITIDSVDTPEEAVESFATSYYGHIVTTDTNKYPEEFL